MQGRDSKGPAGANNVCAPAGGTSASLSEA
jgi:hypothetical protein